MRNRTRHLTLLRAGAASVLAMLLCACSSSGGTRVPGTFLPPTNTLPPAPPAPPGGSNPADYRTPEYNLLWALETIHAAEAYANGFTGNGVAIGFVDFNFEFSSSEVRYDPDSRGPQSQAIAMYSAQTGSDPGDDTHGHSVAVTAAGVKNELGIHGVAFNANVIAVDYFSMVKLRTEFQGGKRYNISDPWTYATENGARIISKSFGYDTGDIIHDPPTVQQYYVIDSEVNAIANGALLVASGGNESGSRPILSNLDTLEEMRDRNLMSGPGAFIIVGATNQNNSMASFSNRAGPESPYFMVAPGVALTIPYNGSLQTVSGTSFSAPLVAGAAAVILERWPTLTAVQLRDILFASATDLGSPGIDAIYGHGLLNLNAALQPVGVTSFAAGDGAPAVDGSALVLGAAFGDAPALRAALTNTMVLDGFGRDFRTDASRLVLSRPGTLPIASILRDRMVWDGGQFAFGAGVASFAFDRDDALSLQSSYGAQRHEPVRSVLQFNGVAENYSWTFGSGLSLKDAVRSESGYGVSPASGLLRGFSSEPGGDPGVFAALRTELGDGAGVTIGVAQSESAGVPAHPLAGFRESALTRSAAIGLDITRDATHFSAQAGVVLEDGLVLGARSAGGLLVGKSAATLWGEFAADTPLTGGWIGQGILTVALTDAGAGGSSLIASIDPILSSSFSFGVLHNHIFVPGDRLSFSVHQPLRAESAPVTLISGMVLDETTGAAILGSTRTSLVPSGREIGLESTYRLGFDGWNAEANLAYRFDAGHIPGRQEAVALFSLSRLF